MFATSLSLVCVQVLAQVHDGLAGLVEQALATEPSLLTAKTELQVAEARLDQSVGGLLPQIRASATTGYNKRNYATRQPSATEKGRYNASGGEISLTVPVIRTAAWMEKRQANVLVEQSASQLEATRQELVHRVVSAWVDVQAAHMELSLAQEKEVGAEQQMRLVRKGASLGAYAQPDLEEALARLKTAQAEHVAAVGELRVRTLALEQLVGEAVVVTVPQTEELGAQVVPDLLALRYVEQDALTLAALEAELLKSNPSIHAAEEALGAAQQAFNRAQASHLPTLDFTASASRNAQGVGTSAGQSGFRSVVSSVALDLRIPLYSGGVDAARVQEAMAQQQAAEYALEGARRKAVAELHRAWYAWLAAKARIEAGTQGVRSGQALRTKAKRGLRQGQQSAIDVVQARVQWLTAQRDLCQAQGELLRSAVRIRTLLADLNLQELQAVDRSWLKPLKQQVDQPQPSGQPS